MPTCGKTRFNTSDWSVCQNISNCDIPLNKSANGDFCACTEGYSMRPDGSCGPSCVNTPINGNPDVCKAFPNCTA